RGYDERRPLRPRAAVAARGRRDRGAVRTAIRPGDRRRVPRAGVGAADDPRTAHRRVAPAYTPAVEFELSPEQRETQSLAREFARDEIEPHASEWDREHRFPR